MKVLAFLFAAISLVVEITSSDSAEAKDEAFTKLVDACATKLEIPQAKLDEYQETSGEPSSDRMAWCLTACIFEKLEVMENGKLTDDLVSVFFEELEDEEEMEKMTKIGETCQKKANGEADECEIAGAFTKCVYAEMQTT